MYYTFDKSESQYSTNHPDYRYKLYNIQDMPYTKQIVVSSHFGGNYGAIFSEYCTFHSETFPQDIIMLIGHNACRGESVFIMLFFKKGIFKNMITDKDVCIRLYDRDIVKSYITGYVENRNSKQIFNDLKNQNRLIFINDSQEKHSYCFDVIYKGSNCVSDRIYCKSELFPCYVRLPSSLAMSVSISLAVYPQNVASNKYSSMLLTNIY